LLNNLLGLFHISKNKNPLLGVFCSKSVTQWLSAQVATHNVKALVEANQKVGIHLFFFSLNDVNFSNDEIHGYYYDREESKWKRTRFPYPDAIYKRSGVSVKEIHRYKTLLKVMKKYDIKMLNSFSQLEKWPVHKHLLQYQKLRPNLPETLTYGSENDLCKMFDSFDSLYLKASTGSLGRQVLRVNKLTTGFGCTYYRRNLKKIHVDTMSELIGFVSKFFRGQFFIIQEAIDLLTVSDRLVDMRAEVQRNGRGKIEIVAIPIRVGLKGAPVTQHSDSYPFEYLKDLFSYSEREIKHFQSMIHPFLEDVYTATEEYCGQCCEMGIDFGIDKNHHLYFIEANSIPTKVSIQKAYDPQTVARAYENVLHYATFIVNQ